VPELVVKLVVGVVQLSLEGMHILQLMIKISF